MLLSVRHDIVNGMPNKGGAVTALEEARRGRGPDECWPWTRYVMKQTGYGQTTYEGKPWLAHRLAWVLEGAELPDGMTLDHLCHTRMRAQCTDGPTCPHRRCVNPAHLALRSRARNALDGNSPLSDNARKTHCDRGHLLEGENLRIRTHKDRAPSRECIPCSRERARENRRRKAEERAQD